ncbi:acid protease [Pluteus cervinus]|uniref:Acid protease n=1 Tax=Pluteus cervinus TaxID=181527 RepID=A0ACD3BCV4_9AGAR|nr:acid protease [Pluteus cervinus]
MADITVAGTVYHVQLDTGSSDLWVQGSVSPIPNAQPTNLALNLTYAIGWAAGNISYAPVEFAGIPAKSQAFLDVSNVYNPALGYGAQGITGLGFTSLSTIDAWVNRTGSDKGRSLLLNLFAADPSAPNFIAFALQRSTDPTDEVQGSFAIGEYEPLYAEVKDAPHIPTWPPVEPSRWNVLLDALIVGDQVVIPETIVDAAPGNKAVVLLDSGSSLTYAPTKVCEAIYGNITGASFDPSSGYWIVPCGYEVDMALQIGGTIYPLHPLDVTPKGLLTPDGCIGSFVPTNLPFGKGDFDWLIGDNFLRSVYSIYDFGDFDGSGNTGNPYMQLLSLIDPDEASGDFAQTRGTQAKTNITYVGLNGTMIQPISTLSTDANKTLQLLGQFFPAIMGIVALNALVLLVLVIGGIVYFCRKRKRSRVARTPRGRQTPVEMLPNPRNTYIAGAPPQAHVYQPVSMAMTEDTFVPPSPAFIMDGSPLKGERPKSVA